MRARSDGRRADSTDAGFEPIHTTMLSLVMRLNDELESEQEVARTAAEWIRSGRAVLTGNFRGTRHFDVS